VSGGELAGGHGLEQLLGSGDRQRRLSRGPVELGELAVAGASASAVLVELGVLPPAVCVYGKARSKSDPILSARRFRRRNRARAGPRDPA